MGQMVACGCGQAGGEHVVTTVGGRFEPRKAVNDSWVTVHAHYMSARDPKARVPQEAFVRYCMSFAPLNAVKRDAFQHYVNILFDSGLAMLLPAKATDLGKHCFGYIALLVNEFYGDEPEDRLGLVGADRPDDDLFLLRAELDQDWENIEKDEDERVSWTAFRDYFLEKYADKLAGASKVAFVEFLEKDFASALAMMLPRRRITIGGHCFRYAALLAGEFYFDTGFDSFASGHAGPFGVRDVLGILSPL